MLIKAYSRLNPTLGRAGSEGTLIKAAGEIQQECFLDRKAWGGEGLSFPLA